MTFAITKHRNNIYFVFRIFRSLFNVGLKNVAVELEV